MPVCRPFPVKPRPLLGPAPFSLSVPRISKGFSLPSRTPPRLLLEPWGRTTNNLTQAPNPTRLLASVSPFVKGGILHTAALPVPVLITQHNCLVESSLGPAQVQRRGSLKPEVNAHARWFRPLEASLHQIWGSGLGMCLAFGGVSFGVILSES